MNWTLKNVELWVKRCAHQCHFLCSRPITVQQGRDKYSTDQSALLVQPYACLQHLSIHAFPLDLAGVWCGRSESHKKGDGAFRPFTSSQWDASLRERGSRHAFPSWQLAEMHQWPELTRSPVTARVTNAIRSHGSHRDPTHLKRRNFHISVQNFLSSPGWSFKNWSFASSKV